MKLHGLFAIALSAVLVGNLSAADPVVSNLSAAQRCETKLLEPPSGPESGSRAMVDPTQTPEGLSDSDWSGIRGEYERHRHAIVANLDGTHQARNPGQAWLTRFDGRGFTVTPDAGGWSWGLELVGCGEVTQVREDGGRISYVRGEGLTEWFVNDSRGLEQGWTLAKRPDRADAGAVHLNLAVRGGLRPKVSPEGTSVAFTNEVGTTRLTYGGLKAWDAEGKPVPARFETGEGGSEFRVAVDDVGAIYPITIDPVAQQAYIKASNAEAGDQFGISVGVFGDTVAVGAPSEDSNAVGVNGNQSSNSTSNSGAVYVYVRTGITWVQQAYLKASNCGGQDDFGRSVAISGDTLVVGARGERSNATGVNGNQTDNSALNSGAAYVFVRSGTTWTQQAYLKASNTGAGDSFGYSVAISGDTVVVGAVNEGSSATGVNGDQADNEASSSGAAYVFVRSGATWSQQAYLKASNTGSDDRFGESIAISNDTVVVGADTEDSNATGVNGNQTDNSAPNSGAAYVFVRSGATWSQQAYLKASNTGADNWFGQSIAASGNTVVVGAAGEDSNATGINGDQSDNSAALSGAAYVFVRSGTTWTQQAYLKASNTAVADQFGDSVAVSGDTVVVGAREEGSSATGVNGNQADNSALYSGAVYVFVRNGTTWTQQAYLKASNTETSDVFGDSVAVFDDTVVVGATYEGSSATGINGDQSNNSAAMSGAVYAFSGVKWYSLIAGGSNGTVTGTGNYEVGATAALVAMPIPGYLFSGWTGDASGTDNPLSVFMDSDKTITVNFIPDTSDADSDGLSAYEEIVVHGTNPNEPDSDHDGVDDGEEVTRRTNPLDPDTDHDGLNDGAEQAAGSNPLLADTDGDGLTDAHEVNLTHTNPKLSDSDIDGVNDAADDEDGDTLSNLAEITQHGTDPLKADTDGDGVNDGTELQTSGSHYQLVAGGFTYAQAAADAAAKRGRVASFPTSNTYQQVISDARQTNTGFLWIGLSDLAAEGTWVWTDGSTADYHRWLNGQPDGNTGENQVVVMENGVQWADAAATFIAGGYILERVGLNPLAADTDGDGLGDGRELDMVKSSPFWADTDGDGLADGAEVDTHGSSPLLADTDSDGLGDREEVEVHHSNPTVKDSDGDGFDDWFEVNTGFDPTKVTSTPDALSSIRTAVEFRFNAANGVSYRIEGSTDLNEWTTVETGIIGTGGVITRFYSTENIPKRYFRARRN